MTMLVNPYRHATSAAPTILAIGGKLTSVTAGASVTESVTAGRFNATYADRALDSTNRGATQQWALSLTTDLSDGQTGYFHFALHWNVNTISNADLIWWLRDASGFPWLGIRTISASAIGLFYNSGTGAVPAWTQLGTNQAFEAALHNHDIQITINSSGTHSVTWFIDNASVVSSTFSQASFTGVHAMVGQGPNTFGASFCDFSELLVTLTGTTVGAHVQYGVSTYTAIFP